jgi:hypothetical protein
MTSLQSYIVQIPRNSHFRPLPSLFMAGGEVSTPQSSFFTFNATSGVAPRLTNTTTTLGATGNFTPHPAMTTAGPLAAMSLGGGLLKDLGETIVSAGRTFRRVQLLTPNDLTETEQVGGTYTGADSDALAGYIELGLRGIGPAGPFVRAL